MTVVTRIDQRETELRQRYGDVLTLADMAPLLRYPSVGAIRKARMRGALQIPVFKMPHRRGWYATPRMLAEFLEGLEPRSEGVPQ